MAADRTALTFTDPATGRTAGHKHDARRLAADHAAIVRALLGCRPRAAGIGFGIASLWDREAVCTSPEEYRLAARLVPERRSDFLIGRRALHNALADIGLDPGGPIGFSGRRPRLPASAVGSISHSAGIAVGIAAPRKRFRSAGVDLELICPPLAAGRLILTKAELGWVHAGTPETARQRLLAAFSAKESVFKALGGLLADGAPPFKAVALQPVNGGFRASAPGVRDMAVHVCQVPGGVLTWLLIRPASEPPP
jgi:hypothetical protein